MPAYLRRNRHATRADKPSLLHNISCDAPDVLSRTVRVGLFVPRPALGNCARRYDPRNLRRDRGAEIRRDPMYVYISMGGAG